MANAGRIKEVGSDGITVEVATPASQPGDIFPSGVILHFAGSAAPTNWQICDGAAVSRATFANLFAVIGTTYGAGDGSTTFNLPDLRGKMIVGKHSSGTFQTLGQTGGEENHALLASEHAVHTHTGTTGTESADHTHSGTTGGESGHTHASDGGANNYVTDGAGAGAHQWGSSGTAVGAIGGGRTGASNGHTHAFSTGGRSAAHTHSFTSDSQGSGTAHNNMPPYFVVHHIIKN